MNLPGIELINVSGGCAVSINGAALKYISNLFLILNLNAYVCVTYRFCIVYHRGFAWGFAVSGQGSKARQIFVVIMGRDDT